MLWEQREIADEETGLGVKGQTIRYWAQTRAISDIHTDATGTPGQRRKYDKRNILEIAVLRELHKKGIPSTVAVQVLKRLNIRKRNLKKFGGLCFVLLNDADTYILDGEDTLKALEQEEPNLPLGNPALRPSKSKASFKDRVTLFLANNLLFGPEPSFTMIKLHTLWAEVEEKFGSN